MYTSVYTLLITPLSLIAPAGTHHFDHFEAMKFIRAPCIVEIEIWWFPFRFNRKRGWSP